MPFLQETASSTTSTTSSDTSSAQSETESPAFEFPDHENFIKLLKEAQRQSELSGVRVCLEWRGYRTHVDPIDPRLTNVNIAMRLHHALKNVNDLTQEEQLVLHY